MRRATIRHGIVIRRVTAGALAAAALLLAGLASAGDSPRPAILFATPKGSDTSHCWVDWAWLKELHEAGFEIDLTEDKGLDELTWERVKHFNVLFLYASQDALDRQWRGLASDPEKIRRFQELITRFTEAGGGLFLMPTETNIRKQVLADATVMMDAKLPAEEIVEDNPENRAQLSHASQPMPLAWTNAVTPSPVSEGVAGFWYPNGPAYMACMTNPLEVGPDWIVVARGSLSSRAIPVQALKTAATGYDIHELEGLYHRSEPVPQPPIFAIREWRGGRVALCPMWRMFSVANGTQWIYNREVLDRGRGNRPSGFGRLLTNSLHWLAEPSLQSGGELGGYRMNPGRLAPPNERPGVKAKFDHEFAPGKFDNQPPAGAPLFKGMIGARTALTAGTGTVADYAAKARDAGLDFLVMLEELRQLTPEQWQTFAAECHRTSTDKLIIYPGYVGRTNLGNRLFLFGSGLPFPPANCLRTDKDGQTVFYQQGQDAKGDFTANNTPLFAWLLDVGHRYQIGVADFTSSPEGMRMDQLRLCGMAAVETYRGGKLVESLLDEYLRTAQGTLPPTPAALNEINSPDELEREVKAGRGLVYAQARDLGKLFAEALRYSCQYDGPNVFPSTGPRIEAWPACARAMTFGTEEFVVEANLMRAPLRVVSDKGLREVAIYNGTELFRRFLPGGAKEFAVDLLLDRTLQKTLVAVAIDTDGGRAVSYPRTCRKSGAISPEFCHDHINDMITISMARGPFAAPTLRAPSLPQSVAGWTWDGGPKGIRQFGQASDNFPKLRSSLGSENANRMLQAPLLLASDELSLQVASERRGQVYGVDGRSVKNPWHTFGPAAGDSALFTCDLFYREWAQPMIAVNPEGWGFGGERAGIIPALWNGIFRFRAGQTVESLELWTLGADFLTCPKPVFVVSGDDPSVSIDVTSLRSPRRLVLPAGGWLGIYSSRVMNSHLLVNQGQDMMVELRPRDEQRKLGPQVAFIALAGQAVAAGDSRGFEIFSLNFPVDMELRDPGDLSRYLDYLRKLPGVRLMRGERIGTSGTLRMSPDNGVVELSATAAEAPERMTLPLQIEGLNPRWSAGLLQRAGYVKGYYGNGANRWRPVAVSAEGRACVPLFVALAPETKVSLGHPVVADAAGRELFIQATRLRETPPHWHVSVNNPTDHPIHTKLSAPMELEGVSIPGAPVEIPAGGYIVLRAEKGEETRQ